MAGTFTYQGRLVQSGASADGVFDLKFSLFDSGSGGNQIGSSVTNRGIAVSNGLFVAQMDFGAAFDGSARWLEVCVSTGANFFVTLQPRQPITPAPMAVVAGGLTGSLPEGQLPGSVPRLNGSQTFTGANSFLGATFAANPANVFLGSFIGTHHGDASGLTNISAVGILAPTNSTWIASTNWVASQGFQQTNAVTRKQVFSAAPVNATNFVVDFSAEVVEIVATNELNFFQSTNRTPPGSSSEAVWYLRGGTTNRTMRFNPAWTGVGTIATNSPVLILSNKLCIVAFSVRGAGETNVTYAIARQE